MTSTTTIRVLELFGTAKRKAATLLLLVALAAGFDITVPFTARWLIDTFIEFFKRHGESPLPVLITAVVVMLVATIASRIVGSIYNFQLFKTVTKIEDTVKNKAFERYLRLHALFHHGSSSGQIIGRIERGATAVYVILYDILGQSLAPSLIVFAGVFTALLLKNIWIALAVFLPLPIYLVVVQKLARKIYEIEWQANEEFEAVARESYDIASNVLTVKKFSREQDEVEHHAALMAKARSTQYSAERLWAIIENMQTFIATLGKVGVISIAGLLVLNGKSTIGDLVLYMTLQGMAYAPLAQISVVFPRLRRNISRAERLFGVLDESVEVKDKPNAITLPSLTRSIVFRDVWFRYAEGARWALKNINIEIPAGQTVALVGRSGSGKTTFINILLRSYDPQRGAVLIDEHDLRDVTQESTRRQAAVVPQEVDLFSRTIADNIAYGRPDAPQEEIERAAKVALAHEFILRAEQGYKTLVGERGIKLSGGERQRIGIARAVLKDPRILILDEATSHLDTESERLIQQATQKLIKNRTSFIIAHRLSTVLGADRILVFKEGEIEAAGTHAELLEKSETYRRLHALQFQDEPLR